MTNTRAGYFRKNLTGEAAYKSFVPNPLPPTVDFDNEMLTLLTKANGSISALENISKRIPDKNLFLLGYIVKEALVSAQIEGTQTTLDDVLDPTVDINANRDVEEVVNYVKAINYAVERLQALPLCNRLLRETHNILMDGVRGQDKTPGEFRTSQNWISGYGVALRNARYVPPCPADMIQAMSDLEKYMNAEDSADDLIRTALIHYQFETIHPFLDGNGRIGRLLITLFLISMKLLTTPALYMSCFLKSNQVEYYDRLTQVRETGNYEQWIKFFLEALDKSADDAVRTIDELVALHDKNEKILQSLGRARINVLRVFQYLETSPIVEIGKTAKALDLSFNATASAINRLVAEGILAQTKKGRRNRIFAYTDYLNILRRGT